MPYSESTPDNIAVQSLVAGGSATVRSSGSAVLKQNAGIFTVSLSVAARSDIAALVVSIYDDGDPDESCDVSLRTNTAIITDLGGTITATSLDGWAAGGVYAYTWEVVLPEPVGDWVLDISTDGATAPVAMPLSGFLIEPAPVPTAATIQAIAEALGGDEGDIVTIGPDGETLVALGVSEAVPAPLYDPDVLLGTGSGDPAPATGRTPTQVRTTLNVADGAGMPLVPNVQSGTSYTLAATDHGRPIELTNAAAITLIVPLNDTVPLPVGFECALFQGGAGVVTVTPESGSVNIKSLGGLLDLAGEGAAASLIQMAADEWYLIGSLA